MKYLEENQTHSNSLTHANHNNNINDYLASKERCQMGCQMIFFYESWIINIHYIYKLLWIGSFYSTIQLMCIQWMYIRMVWNAQKKWPIIKHKASHKNGFAFFRLTNCYICQQTVGFYLWSIGFQNGPSYFRGERKCIFSPIKAGGFF